MTSRQPRSAPPALLCFALALALTACSAGAPEMEPPEPEVQQSANRVPAEPDLTHLLPNGREPLPGVIAGGQPTREQLDAAATLGVRTVINLRTAGESEIGRQDVEERGMAYVAIPVEGSTGLTADNAALLDAALAEAESPVLVHCGSGNRVGALFALRAHFIEGATSDEALAFGKAAGVTGLEGALREVLEADAEPRAPSDRPPAPESSGP